VESLGKALEEHGFLYLTGHGLSRELRQRLFDAAEAFFALPMENKMVGTIRAHSRILTTPKIRNPLFYYKCLAP
jgi:isopenicillin N synthase-like dioxygenase